MTWEIDVDHIAGILEGSATLEPGPNAVRASNWQGKSSFVEAIETGLGVSTALTEGSERGGVTIRTPERTVSVDLRRENGTVHRDGEPYLTDEYDVARAELFACLGESNPVRRAVREGRSLEEVLLRPLDLENLDERIADLKHERESAETELAQATEARRRIPTVRSTVEDLEAELEDLRERHERLTAEADADARGDVESAQSALAAARSEREEADDRIERLERSIERVADRREEIESELAALDPGDQDDLAADLAEARDELQAVKRDREVVESMYSATELALTENRLDLLGDVQRELTGDSVVCWTCGQEADRSDVEDGLERLGETIAELRAETERRRDEVETLEARREDARQAHQRQADLEAEREELRERLGDLEASLAEATRRRDQAAERVDELSTDVDETVAALTDVESDIKYREAELADKRDELESLERRAGRVETLESEVESLTAELEAVRNRKDDITYEAREAFDEAMTGVLELFDTGFEAARLTSAFELVVARDGGEASLEALSEGELELLGFVAALAGFEAFDVAETVPVMLVDGVGGLDDENLHRLVDYLEDRTQYLVFTVYPEYSAFEGAEIDPGDWDVASGPESAAG